MMRYPVLIFLSMGGWSFLHSWLAAFSTKKLAQRIFGVDIVRFYRLFFVVIAILTLTPILAMVMLLPPNILWIIPSPWLYLTLLIQFLAMSGLVITVLQTDAMAFVGVRQVTQPNAEKESGLVKTGLYGVVRHPLYLFSIIFLWLIPYMTDLILVFNIACTLYFLIGTIPEEQKLLEVHGEAYRRYQEEVPRIIPSLKSINK